MANNLELEAAIVQRIQGNIDALSAGQSFYAQGAKDGLKAAQDIVKHAFAEADDEPS